MIALYDGEIYNADQQIGGLLDEITALGLDKKTIIVFYADHGDMFGKHGRFMRGGPLRGTFYDDVLHIPLIVYHPKLGHKTFEDLGQVIDLAPTLLDMLGLKAPPEFRGRSLMPAVTNQVAVNDYVFAGSAFTPSQSNPLFSYPSVIASARNRQWKLIVERVSPATGPQDSVELYELQRDPEELTNVAERNPEVLKTMKTALKNWLQSIESEKLLPIF
jgi:arylsulfatase A-like enzyme